MPSGTTVNEAILNLLDEETKFIQADIVDVKKFGGEVSCDGRKGDTWEKYHEIIVSFFDIQGVSAIHWYLKTLKSQLLFIANHFGSETAFEIRGTIGSSYRE